MVLMSSARIMQCFFPRLLTCQLFVPRISNGLKSYEPTNYERLSDVPFVWHLFYQCILDHLSVDRMSLKAL
jgi:hypothetical protein